VTAAVPSIARHGRCVVMGILNVTPDSFSDGGRYDSLDAAVAHGLELAAAGANYSDVGGESTRPGAGRVAPEEERRRVLPVVTALAGQGVAVSIDTTRASVATAALDAGAVLVNDVSGGLADPGMAPAVADAGVPWVLMHRRGDSRDMYARATYDDVVSDVRRELCRRVDAALSAGVAAERIVVDPGLGFAKQPEHDLTLLAAMDRIAERPDGTTPPSRPRCSPQPRAHGACVSTTWRAAWTPCGWSPRPPGHRHLELWR
jgi:dihydropteroate synthase